MKKNVLMMFAICFMAASQLFAAAPTITAGAAGFSPASQTYGQTVTITGTNFQGTTIVKFNGNNALSFTIKPDGTEIYAVLGYGSGGKIYVENPDGNFTNDTNYSYVLSKPTITAGAAGFSPASANSGSVITIKGTNFIGTSIVRFGGLDAASFTIKPDGTEIYAVLGKGTSGTIFVQNPDGNVTNATAFVCTSLSITSFTPTSAKKAVNITVTGNAFTATTVVKFGGVVASIVSQTATSIVASTSDVGNSGLVTVEDGALNSPSAATFQFLPSTTNPLIEGEVVINKVYNANDTDGSGDAVEILVVKDHADLRALYLKDWQPNKNGGLLTFFFREIAFFSDVRAGTLIVMRNSPTSADTNGSDFVLDLGLQDVTYFNAGNASTSATAFFDIGKDDIMSLQKSASGTTGIIAMLGSGPTVVNLPAPNTSTPSSFNSGIYTRLNSSTTVTPNNFVYVTNRNSNIADYKHLGAAANTNYDPTLNADRIKTGTSNDSATPTALVLGQANNATNATYITGLRATVLPVNLISFTAKKGTNGIELNWATASEQNNNRFELQRSADGNSFVTIKTVTGANNANTRNNYSFIDKNPIAGVNYYKLVQIDNNGTTRELGVQAVSSDLQGLSFSVASNDGANQVNCAVNATVAGNATIKIFNTSGAQIASSNVVLVAGNNSLKLNIGGLTTGVYVAVLSAENQTLTSKFVK